MRYNVVQSSMRKKSKYNYEMEYDCVELLDDSEGMFNTHLDYSYTQSFNLSDENDYETRQENNGLQPKNLRSIATDRYIKRIGKGSKLLR